MSCIEPGASRVPRTGMQPCRVGRLLALGTCALLLGCDGQNRTTDACVQIRAQPLAWQRVAGTSSWTPRDSAGEVVFDGRMWLLGGWVDSYSPVLRDVWNSTDGVNWSLVQPSAPWLHADLASTVSWRQRMWLVGGWQDGRLPGAAASSNIWSSTNGVDWTLVTDTPGWTPRLGAPVVEFKDRLWILGGVEDYYSGDSGSLRNDVWSSADGLSWELVTANADWSPRAYHQAFVFRDRLWVVGGGNYTPEYFARNDVWSSADGREWRLESAAAPWHPRIWFSASVYRNLMWVVGGYSRDPVVNWDDTWFSSDGRSWSKLDVTATFPGRHEQSAWVHDDRLWVAGGFAGPLVNDVWSLSLPAGWGECQVTP